MGYACMSNLYGLTLRVAGQVVGVQDHMEACGQVLSGRVVRLIGTFTGKWLYRMLAQQTRGFWLHMYPCLHAHAVCLFVGFSCSQVCSGHTGMVRHQVARWLCYGLECVNLLLPIGHLKGKFLKSVERCCRRPCSSATLGTARS